MDRRSGINFGVNPSLDDYLTNMSIFMTSVICGLLMSSLMDWLGFIVYTWVTIVCGFELLMTSRYRPIYYRSFILANLGCISGLIITQIITIDKPS
jgi:hypothetical protein